MPALEALGELSKVKNTIILAIKTILIENGVEYRIETGSGEMGSPKRDLAKCTLYWKSVGYYSYLDGLIACPSYTYKALCTIWY